MDKIAIKEPIEVIEKDKVGRPCKYTTHVEPYLNKVYEWLKKGYTDYSIAEQLGICQETFIKYKNDNLDLSNLYARARTEKNCLVMHKQFEKAIGYEHEDLFIAQYQGNIVEKKIKKHYPPDVQAADLYLRNNDPEYKSAKAETGITLVQNTFQLPEAKAKVEQLLSEREKVKAIDITAYEIAEA